MASDPVIPNCAQIRMLWSDPIRTFMNVLHAENAVAGPLNPSVADTLFAAFKTSLSGSGFVGFLPPTTSLIGVDVRDLRAANNPLISSSGAAEVGTSTSTALPPQTAIVITLRTAFAGRAFRGRVYLGGLAQNAADLNGDIADAANAAANGFIANVRNNIGAQFTAMAIAQRHLPARPAKDGSTLPERQAAVVPVTATLARDKIFDTQRRRTGARIGSR